MRRNDKLALKLAIEAVRARDDASRRQIDNMLSGGEDFDSVAKFASSSAQSRSLDLKPWEICPADFLAADLSDPRHQRGARAAYELLQRMERCGVSKFHPDPITACLTAERQTPA